MVHRNPQSTDLIICRSQRLVLRKFVDSDAPFILELLNDPDFIRHVQDRNIRTLDDARAYLRLGPYASFEQYGHGLNCVVDKVSGESMGMCGMLKRPTMDFPDIGYSFLPSYRGKGFAREAAIATIKHAHENLNMNVMTAVVNKENRRSIHLLESIGFRSIGPLVFQEGEPTGPGFCATCRA